MGLRERQDMVFNELENLGKDSKVDVVEPAECFHKDTRICLTMINLLPAELAKRITQEIVEPLQEADQSQYYYPAESIHITIQNIRVVSDPPRFTADDIERVKGLNLNGRLRFELSGMFRMASSIGIRGYPDEKTVRFILGLRKRLAEIGVPDDKSYVHPEVVIGNTSVCRFHSRPNKEFSSVYERVRSIELGAVKADRISLVSTDCVCHPKKTVILHEWAL